MSSLKTKDWMTRNHLKSVIVYFHEMMFERVQAAAKANGCSKGNLVYRIVVEALRKRSNQ